MPSNKFQWKPEHLVFEKTEVEKSHLRVIHYANDSDLPQSVRDKVTDAVAQTVFRQSLNDALSQGKSEMHSFIAAYKSLETAGYQRDVNDQWITKGGPGSGPHGSNALNRYNAGEKPLASYSNGRYTTHVMSEPDGKGQYLFQRGNGTIVPGNRFSDFHESDIQDLGISKDKYEAMPLASRAMVNAQIQTDKYIGSPSIKIKGTQYQAWLKEYRTLGKQGGPAGIGLPGEPPPDSDDFVSRSTTLNTDSSVDEQEAQEYMNYLERLIKSSPTLQQTHVNRPLGSEEKDDPGTQFTDPDQNELQGATIQNPEDGRDRNDPLSKGGPGSGPHSSESPKDIQSNIKETIESLVQHGGMSGKDINEDHCGDFALAVARTNPNVTVYEGNNHTYVGYRGKFYDAESPKGVNSPEKLKFFGGNKTYSQVEHEEETRSLSSSEFIQQSKGSAPSRFSSFKKGGPGSGPHGSSGLLSSSTGSKVVVNKPGSPNHGKEGTVLRQLGHDHAIGFKDGTMDWHMSNELVNKLDDDVEEKDDPGGETMDYQQPDYASVPNYAAITSFQGDGNQDPENIYHKGGPGSGPHGSVLAHVNTLSPHGGGSLKIIAYHSNQSLGLKPFHNLPKVDGMNEKNIVGHVELISSPNVKGHLESNDVWVHPNFRNQGIARAMYSHAKNLGYSLTPSSDQLNLGSRMWKGSLSDDVSKRISGSSDISLNTKGKSLAAKLGVRIADKGCLDVIYSSPLNRGKETAEEILEVCPRTTYASPNAALQPWHLGAFEGQTGSDASDGISHYVDNPDERPPGKGPDGTQAETFNESKTRQLTFWKKIYEDWAIDPTLKIGVICHSRGFALLQAWVDADCPSDFDLDEDDIHDPDDEQHASMYRWHKDEIKDVDLDDDDPLKPGVYPILHSLTDDDTDDGNKDLKPVQKYLPPIEVQRAAKSAWDVGCSVIDITSHLSEGSGLTEAGVREVAKHFDAIESVTDLETTRNAWGGILAGKWAQRVLKKIERDYPKWIGIDFDGTLAKPVDTYGGLKLGEPIKGSFFNKVKQAVKAGKSIRILTARVAHDPGGKVANAIKAWTLKYLGKELPVTNEKDPGMTEIWDDKAHHPNEITKVGSGVMVAFAVDPKIAAKLKLKDGEDPDDMHVTLVYLGKDVDASKIKSLETMLIGFAGTFAPIDATLRGPTRFSASASSEGKDVCVANVESKTLHKFREDLLNKVESLGIEVKTNFSFTPHITLKYMDPKDDLPVQRIDPIEVTFNAITLYDKGDKKWYPLSGTAVAKSSGTGIIIEAVKYNDQCVWAHVSCPNGERVAFFFDPGDVVVQLGDQITWDSDNDTASLNGKELGSVEIIKATGSKEGTWITVNGQHILVGADGKPMNGNPKVLGQRSVSAKVETARKNAVLTGKHEQDIADRGEEKLSKALGIPRTRNNSAFDLRNDEVGIEVKTMTHGVNDKITMGKEALGRKLAESRAEGLKTYTVVADMRGRTQAKYYVKEGLGSFRVGSMHPISLTALKELVTR